MVSTMLPLSRRLILVSPSKVLLTLLALLPILSSLLLVFPLSLMLSRLLDRFSIACTPTLSTVLPCLCIWKSSLASGLLSLIPVLTLNLSSSLLFSPILLLWLSPTTMLHSQRHLSSGTYQNFGVCPSYSVLFLLLVLGLLSQPCSHIIAQESQRIHPKVLTVVLFRTLVSVMKLSSFKSHSLRTGLFSSLVPMDLSGVVFHHGNFLELSSLLTSSLPSSVFLDGSLVVTP